MNHDKLDVWQWSEKVYSFVHDIQKICELVENLQDVEIVGKIPENISAERIMRGFDPKGEIYNEELRKESSPKHAKRI